MNSKQETYLHLARELLAETDEFKKNKLTEALGVIRPYLEPDITNLHKELGIKE